MSEEETVILPEGFKRVEYLKSIGSQYIDTKYVPTNETGYFIKYQTNQTDTIWRPVFGLYEPNVTNNRIYLYSNPYPCIGWHTGNQLTTLTDFQNGELSCSFNYFNNRKVVVTKNENQVSRDLTPLQFTPSVPLYLFSAYGVSNITNNGSMVGKISSFIITEGNEVVKHFIPCLDNDDVPCMYDILGTGTIEENTYYNQGTGKFLTPKDFEWNYPFINNDYNLPAGFKKCVYLQSDGTQWIDTGVIPNNETGLYFNALQLSYGNFMPFGVEESGNTIYPPRFSSKNLYYRWGASAIKMMTWDKADDLIFHSSINLYNSKIAKFNSEDTDVVTSIISQTGTYTLPIWLFSYNYRGSYNSTYGKWVGRIYRAQITQGTDLIHDYVPCLDANGRPCMYDIIGGGTVEDNTYYNQSGGTEFAYCVEHQLPSDFVKLKYLESDGTQYIKTGYVPTNTTGLYIDTQDVGSGDAVPMGTRNDTGNTRFFVSRQTSTGNTGYGWGAWVQISTTKGSVRYDSTLNWLNDRKSITNSPSFVTIINNLGELPHTPLYGINLFGVNQNNVNINQWKGRIYRAKISEGSDIVRDFVPAYDTLKQRPCMYDLINNVAYYNDGEGEFLHNRDFEGTYKGYTGLGCIGNRLGASEFEWKIPYGYRRVAYLESTGAQYIKTGLKADRLNSIVDFMPFYATDGGSGSYYLGCWNRNSNYQIGAQQYENNMQGVITQLKINNTNNRVQFGIKSGTRITGEINFSEKFIRMGTEKLEIPDLINYPYPNATVYLFAQNTVGDSNNAEGGPQNIPRGRIYSFKANYDGIPIADYIPCLDPNNKPCMFDLITQQPFYNKGNGEDFKYGLF